MQAKVIFCQMCLRLSYFIYPSKPIRVDTGNFEKKEVKIPVEEQKSFLMSEITLGIKKKKKDEGGFQTVLLLSAALTSLSIRTADS